MATASELMSYGGNTNIGTGSNASVPVSTTKELNAIEDSGRTATLLNAQRNMYLFRQRITDRDKLLEALQAGLVKAGNILERDRPMFNSAVDKQTQAFKKWGGNPNDIDGALAYKKATQEAQDIVTKAQARYLTDVAEKQLIAAETSTEKRKRIQDNLDNYYKKGFYADFTPHQELLDFNHNELNTSTLRDALVTSSGVKTPQETIRKTTTKMVNGKLTTVDVTTNQPVKAGTTKAALSVQPNGALSVVSTVPGKYYDYDKILTNASDDFVHDEKVREYQNMWRSYIENANPLEAKKVLDYTNQRLAQYNQERGFTEGDKGYVKPIEMDVDAVLDPSTGKFHINLPTAEFAAKTALASINGSYVEKDQSVFNKDVGAYLVAKERADADALYKRAMAAAANTKARAYADNIRQQMKLRKTQEEQDALLDEMWKRNLTQQPSLIGNVGSPFAPIENKNSLPIFTLDGKLPKLLIPLGATPVTDLSGKVLYYEGGHYEPVYQMDGKNVSSDQMAADYSRFKNVYEKNGNQKWLGGFDAFVKQAVENDKYRVLLKGANGTTDQEVSRAAQRIISNTNTKKGQEEIFSDVPSDDQIPDNNE